MHKDPRNGNDPILVLIYALDLVAVAGAVVVFLGWTVLSVAGWIVGG
jgi:hypothetical protein